MKALIVFLVFFIATPLFFIDKYFIEHGDTNYFAIAIINICFVLAAYIAIDCRNKSRHDFWRGIAVSTFGIGVVWYSTQVIKLGHVPEVTGRGRIAYELLNYIHEYAGGYGVFMVLNILSALSFYAAYTFLKKYT